MGGGESPYHAFKISDRLTKIVEADEYGQNPFMYIVRGRDRLVLIDTGCATGDLASFITEHANPEGLPIQVVNSHSHFDHIGCNYQYADPSGWPIRGSLGVAMSGLRKEFTSNYFKWCCAKELNFPLKAFSITRWLSDGERISLSDSDPSDYLQVLLVPGHCPDSLALFDPLERRLFVGDVIYRYYPICIFTYGANFDEFVASLERLIAFVDQLGGFHPTTPIVLSAGHVNDNLPASYLYDLLDLLLRIKNNEVEAVPLTTHVSEYNQGEDLCITVNTDPHAPLTKEDLFAGSGVPPDNRWDNWRRRRVWRQPKCTERRQERHLRYRCIAF